MKNQKLTFKEFAVLTVGAIIATPVVYSIVTVEPFWWL